MVEQVWESLSWIKDNEPKHQRDTLLTIAHLVQGNMVDDFLTPACHVMVHRGSEIAQENDIHLAIVLRCSRFLYSKISSNVSDLDGIEWDSAIVAKLGVIVDHFTKSAGIPEIDSSTAEYVWMRMLALIGVLLESAAYYAIEYHGNIQPVHIERAATRLGLLHDRVYGVSTSDSEVSSSESESEDDDTKSSEDDSESLLSIHSDDDGISIHSDDDCPDKNSDSDEAEESKAEAVEEEEKNEEKRSAESPEQGQANKRAKLDAA